MTPEQVEALDAFLKFLNDRLSGIRYMAPRDGEAANILIESNVIEEEAQALRAELVGVDFRWWRAA